MSLVSSSSHLRLGASRVVAPGISLRIVRHVSSIHLSRCCHRCTALKWGCLDLGEESKEVCWFLVGPSWGHCGDDSTVAQPRTERVHSKITFACRAAEIQMRIVSVSSRGRGTVLFQVFYSSPVRVPWCVGLSCWCNRPMRERVCVFVCVCVCVCVCMWRCVRACAHEFTPKREFDSVSAHFYCYDAACACPSRRSSTEVEPNLHFASPQQILREVCLDITTQKCSFHKNRSTDLCVTIKCTLCRASLLRVFDCERVDSGIEVVSTCARCLIQRELKRSCMFVSVLALQTRVCCVLSHTVRYIACEISQCVAVVTVSSFVAHCDGETPLLMAKHKAHLAPKMLVASMNTSLTG